MQASLPCLAFWILQKVMLIPTQWNLFVNQSINQSILYRLAGFDVVCSFLFSTDQLNHKPKQDR
jgi:hypothetical protein